MKFAASAAVVALLSLPHALGTVLEKRRVHRQGASRAHFAREEDTFEDDGDEAKREDLLAERDDLRGQLATKSREFLEQHRKADRYLYQLRAQRQREKVERRQLREAEAALAQLGKEAAAAAAAVNATSHELAEEEHEHVHAGAHRSAHEGKLPVAKAFLEVSETKVRAGVLKKETSRAQLSRRARLEMDAEAFLEQSHQQAQEASRLAQEAELQVQDKSIQLQIDGLNKAGAEAMDKAQAKVHDVMLQAAGTVHSLEDKVDGLQDDLDKETAAYKEAHGEEVKAEDTLMQQTQTALKASQAVEALSTSLAAIQKRADDSSKRAAELLASVKSLHRDSLRSRANIQDISDNGADVHGQVESLQKSYDEAKAQAHQSAVDNAALQKQVDELTRKSRQADSLADQLKKVQHQADANASKIDSLQQQITRVNELKEHYAQQLGGISTAVSTLQAKAEDLDHRLVASEREETEMVRQRDEAQVNVRQARGDADQYFDENSRLQQQRDGLLARISEVKSAINASQSESIRLQAESTKLRDKADNEKEAKADQWKSTQADLQEVRDEISSNNMLRGQDEEDIDRTQALLTAEQRQHLGLSPAAASSSSKAQAPPVVAPAAEEEQSLPQMQQEEAEMQQASGLSGDAAAPATAASSVQQEAPVSASPSSGIAATTLTKKDPLAGMASALGALGAGPAKMAVATPAPPQLRGEPRRPKDSNQVATAIFASVSSEKVSSEKASSEKANSEPVVPAAIVANAFPTEPPMSSIAAAHRSTLEKLAAYFASPIKH